MLNQSTVDYIVEGKTQVNVPHDKAYVCGFLFQGDDLDKVALIKKKRPAWQAGKLNGIGGSIESGETPLNAMRREFFEETGKVTDEWRCFAIHRHLTSVIYMFVAFTEGGYCELTQTTDEEVGWWHVTCARVKGLTIPNLRWLIPLALSESHEVVIVADDKPLPRV